MGRFNYKWKKNRIQRRKTWLLVNEIRNLRKKWKRIEWSQWSCILFYFFLLVVYWLWDEVKSKRKTTKEEEDTTTFKLKKNKIIFSFFSHSFSLPLMPSWIMSNRHHKAINMKSSSFRFFFTSFFRFFSSVSTLNLSHLRKLQPVSWCP